MDFVRGAGGTPPVATVRLIGTVGCVHPLLPPSYNSVGGGAGRVLPVCVAEEQRSCGGGANADFRERADLASCRRRRRNRGVRRPQWIRD